MKFIDSNSKIISNSMLNSFNKTLFRASSGKSLYNFIDRHDPQGKLSNRINLKLGVLMSEFSIDGKVICIFITFLNFFNPIKNSYFTRNQLIKFMISFVQIKIRHLKIFFIFSGLIWFILLIINSMSAVYFNWNNFIILFSYFWYF